MLIDDFLGFIDKNKLFTPKDKILLAVSGGIDSVVMSHLFARAGFMFAIAHINYALRGRESQEDAAWVAQWAESLKVPFFLHEASPPAAGNIQSWARKLRYDWFKQLLQTKGYDYVATAHHANDVLETVLFRLCRGGGIAAVHGILPKQAFLVRPLLFATRAQIMDYARHHALSWREDSSNATDKYRRNYLRHHVVPHLREINPKIEATVWATTCRIREVEEVWEEYVTRWRQNVFYEDEAATLHFAFEHLPRKVALWQALLAPYGVSFDLAEQLIEACGRSQAGAVFYTATHCLLLDRGELLIRAQAENAALCHEELLLSSPKGNASLCFGSLYWELLPGRPSLLSADPCQAYLDADKLNFPLKVRLWQAGDRFCPFGMKGKSKKVSDFLINIKLSRFEKERQYVLADAQGRIAWVLGRRIDERFALNASTQNVLFLSWTPKP
ncbi:tRNA(Ile)-lysidine synthase [Thermonema lapsum]|uniref:tRNA(Ile)-lysidine synthase n=1 Tax=Thermonema lapsum TaxID=28195 RepID=A0A846MMX0_9BACT|nr:tRNA lysidine(34) synthetase TilS [Thermonema lapsum]NIK72801.1 tRNA(Ile)-lysidine synthase [Thermonema lapsum]